jgi:hypothetical protein
MHLSIWIKSHTLIGLYLLSTTLLVQQALSQEVRVSAILELPTITQGVPAVISLRFQVENNTKINLGEDRTQGIQFEVRGPSSENKLITIPLPEGGFRSLGSFQLDPHYPYEQMLVLAPSNFSQPGSYEIYVHIQKSGNSQFKFDEGYPLTLSVISRDEEALRGSCSQLAAKLGETSSAARRIELSRALASINDPVVLPFLAASLDHGWGVDYQLINGLEKVGNSDAVAALAQALKSDKPDISTGARAALTRLGRNAQDEQIRTQANTSLLRKE